MKLNFKVAFAKGKNDLALLQEDLSKGGFVKPAPGLWPEGLGVLRLLQLSSGEVCAKAWMSDPNEVSNEAWSIGVGSMRL